MVLLGQMITLFIFMIIGYCMRRGGVFDAVTARDISWLIVNIANPCLLLSGVFSSEQGLTGGSLRTTLLLCLYVYSILIVFSLLMPFLLRVPKEERGTWRIMTAFCNIGFMGFPLLRVMFGPEALVYAAPFTICFSFLIYTYGIDCLSGSGAEKPSPKARLLHLVNVGTIAAILAMIFSFRKPPLPSFAISAFDYLGALPTALSMIVIGASLAENPLKSLFTDVRLLAFAAVKLLVIPIPALLILKHFAKDPFYLGLTMIMLATPTAALVAMMAQQYDPENTLPSRGVAVTTLFSVVTIPLVSAIIGL